MANKIFKISLILQDYSTVIRRTQGASYISSLSLRKMINNRYVRSLVLKASMKIYTKLTFRNYSTVSNEGLVRNTTADTLYTKEFLNTLPCIMDELTPTDNPDPNYKQPYDLLKKTLEENIKGGRSMRSLLVPHVYYDFVKTEQTPEMRKKVMILAWCNELVRIHVNYVIRHYQLVDIME